MTQTTFTDNVVIDGSEDTEQLRVQGHTTQTDPLQTWENSAAGVLAQVTGDGRLTVGDDLGAATPDALLEVHRDAAAVAKPKRGLHSLGKITTALGDALAWAVAELELLGSSGVSGLQAALRARLTHSNTGSGSSAELRAGDFQVLNQTGTSGTRVGQAAGVRGTASNDANAYLSKAVGVEAAITNASGGEVTDAAGFEVAAPTNSGTISTLYGLRVPDLTQGGTNFAIHTGVGPARFGDFVEMKRPGSVPGTPATDLLRLYPKSDGKLYAKNWSGQEYDLTTPALADGSVTTSKLADDAVTLAKMGHGTPNKYLGYDANGAPAELSSAGTLGSVLEVTKEPLVVHKMLYSDTLTANGTWDIDLTTIPGGLDYTHLKIVYTARGTVAAVEDQVRIHFNNDSVSTNYRYNFVYSNGSAVSLASADLPRVPGVAGSTAPTGWFGSGELMLFNYRDTGQEKNVTGLGRYRRATTSSLLEIAELQWENTAAINRIQIRTDNHPTDVFVPGSRIEIWGIKEQEVVTDVSGRVPPGALAVTKQAFQMREVIYEQTLTANGIFDISDLDQTYDHLEIIASLKSNVAATGDLVHLYLNNDATLANYRFAEIICNSGGSPSASSGDQPLAGGVPATTAPADNFSLTHIFIPYYRATDRHKVYQTLQGTRASATGVVGGSDTSWWESTAAINRITLRPDGGSDTFVIGSSIQVVGIKNVEVVTAVEGGSAVTFIPTATGTVANTTTETGLLGSGVGTQTIAADTLTPGKSVRLKLRGIYSTKATTPGSLQLRIKLGNSALLATAALALPGGMSNAFWELEGEITVRSTGQSGTVIGQGQFLHIQGTGAAVSPVLWPMINTTTATLDTTVAHDVTVTAQWETADAENAIQCTNAVIEILN